MKNYLFLFLLFPFLVYSKPTMEGLFRNINNPDLTGELSIVRVMLEEMNNESFLKKTKIEDQPQEVNVDPIMMEKKTGPKFLKFLFSTDKNNKVGVVQIEYNDNKMDRDGISRVEFFPNLLKELEADSNLQRKLFYSLVLMYSLNDSRPISDTLKKLDVDFKTNEEIINTEKKNLLTRYKNYLEAIKRDPELKESIPNPMKPETDEEKEKVKVLEVSSIYNETDKINLTRKEGEFYWELGLNNIQAIFHNETLRMQRLKVSSIGGEIEIRPSGYILFDGVHELPKTIIIKTLDQRLFKLVFLDFKNYANTTKNISTRATDYKKYLEEQNKARGYNLNSTDFDNSGKDLTYKSFLF